MTDTKFTFPTGMVEDLGGGVARVHLAPAGPAGATGPTGPAGAAGPTGPTGTAGAGVPTGGATGQYLRKSSGADYASAWTDNVGSLAFLIDGGGQAIAAGIKGDLIVPYAGTITTWTILADQSGSITIDLWKAAYANYPPVVGNSITASAKPTITSATKAQSSTLTGWTTSVSSGDIIRINVDTAATITRATLVISITRS